MKELEFIKAKEAIEAKHTIELDDYVMFRYNEHGKYIGREYINLELSDNIKNEVEALHRKATFEEI